MAVDIYDSQYLLILAPSLVIALMFLFFWLFMKETSYDEVLAKQKRDLKLPPSKPDTRKKNEKKKSKKKESASGGGGGGSGGGESEEDLRDFEGTDGGNGPALEVEEEPSPVVARDVTPLTTSAYVPVSVMPEAPTGLRERKKKEKKAARAAAAAAAAAANAANAAATDASAANDTTSEEPEVNGSKSVTPKAGQPQAVSTLPNPSTVQLEDQVQIQTAQVPPQALTPPESGKKREKKKQKAEAGEHPGRTVYSINFSISVVNDHEMLFSSFLLGGSQQPEPKTEQAPPPAKKEPLIIAETKVPDGSAPTSPPTGGKKKNSAKKQKTEHGTDYSLVKN